MGDINAIVHRKDSGGSVDRKQQFPTRLSGTNPEVEYAEDDRDGELGPAIGRTGNDHKTPDYDSFLVEKVVGDRLQDFANSHLSEGPAPGRIPRRWTNLVNAVLGKHITGEPNGDTGFIPLAPSGGAEDMMYIPHIQIPRGVGVSRAYMRTVDDAAPIPAIYIADPTRR